MGEEKKEKKPVYIPWFFSYDKKFELLTRLEKAELLELASAYGQSGDVPENIPPALKTAFSVMKYDIDVTFKNYSKRCQKNAENINKRWHPDEFDTEKDGGQLDGDTSVYETYQGKGKGNGKEKGKNNSPPKSPKRPAGESNGEPGCYEQQAAARMHARAALSPVMP